MTSCGKLNIKSVFQILKQCHRTTLQSQVKKHAFRDDVVLSAEHLLRGPHFTYCRRFYCQKLNSDTGGITSSILQSRVETEENKENADSKNEQQKDGDKTKQDKKGFTMFGRFISWQNAGMGFFFITMSGTLTSLVSLWGNYNLV